MEIDATRSILDTQYDSATLSGLNSFKESIFGRRLVISDVDSTFIKNEVIDLLADIAGEGAKVAQITESAMRGEIDFTESLQMRVNTLTNQPISILEEAMANIELSNGAIHLVNELHKAGHIFALVSGGFIQILEPIALQAGVKYFLANDLEISGGFLTGHVKGAVVDAKAKAEYLEKLAITLEIPLSNTIAIGDGANDLEMMQQAGISVSFNGKPKVRQFADIHLNGSFIDHVLALI